jgi:CubicO group peptidase (beta-lactamase class C family)
MAHSKGSVQRGFEGVREAFEANFDAGIELGASLGVYVDGQEVVNLWGGLATAPTTDWTADTVAVTFSSTKGMTAACANMCIDRGLLDIDAPVTSYWPEFGQAGKDTIPVRWLLTHQSGVVAVDEPISMEDIAAWDPVIHKIERQAPAFTPGTATGYHASTYGWLVGEVVRRVAGRSVGTFFAEEIAEPLGLDAWIGMPSTELTRLATIEQTWNEQTKPSTMAADTLAARVFANPGVIDPDDERNVTAERPAGGGVTNGRSLARMYASLIGEVDGTRLLSAQQLDTARRCSVSGTDAVLGTPVARGLGFMVHHASQTLCGPGSFGHMGAGGSFGLADPERGVAVGYVMNRMCMAEDSRFPRLLNAVLASLDH